MTVTGFVISRASAAELAAAAETINGYLAGPGFDVQVSEVLPLAQMAQAHERVEAGERGRLVVTTG